MIDKKIQIGSVIAIAFVAGVIGTVSITTLAINSDLDSQDQSNNIQTLRLGANVLVEAYNKEGELYYSWEGHNDLTAATRNLFVGCITGEFTDYPNLSSPAHCVWDANYMGLTYTNDLGQDVIYFENSKADLSIIPDGCSFNSNQCTGWELKKTFDMIGWDGLCPSEIVGACEIKGAFTSGTDGLNVDGIFNTVEFGPFAFTGTDRVIITMTFDVPS